VKRLIDAVQRGEVCPEEITPAVFDNYLYTAGLPDPDLLIRTGGERRLSNFLLWQSPYTELYFTEVLWPDFRGNDLLRSILDYQQRERRFGMTHDQVLRR
jgi:undecaprenyl diphosphate synthase